MNIAELIMKLANGTPGEEAIPGVRSPAEMPFIDPHAPASAILAGPEPRQPEPPPQAAPQAPLPPIPNAPQGARTPITNPQVPAEAPKIMQSPPDLANMYIQLIQQSRNAAALDSGLSTIAAGFSKYPENRAALLASAGRAAPGTTMTASDLINLQKQQTANQDMLLRRSLLGGLAKQYN